MKITRFLFIALAFLLLPGLPILRATGITVSEPPDFPNSAPGTGYTLGSGTSTFSGTVTSGTDPRDYFNVTIPAGLRITQVTETTAGGNPQGLFVSFNNEEIPGPGSGTFTGAGAAPYPLPPGNYQAYVNADFSTGSAWSISILVEGPPDYDITTAGGVITVVNNTNNADALAVSQPGAGTIGFAAPNRTFSVNGGHNNSGSSTAVSLSGITAITINGGSGGETFNVGAFGGTSFPSLTIVGGAGNDTVNFTGGITFASGNSLSVNLQNGGGSPGTDAIYVTGALQIRASGTGTIDLECSQNVSISSGAVVETQNGGLTVMANQQAAATPGNFDGVDVDGTGTIVGSTGSGAVIVKGTGGNDSGGYQLGVYVADGAQVISSQGTLTVTGTGGASTGSVNRGVTVYGTGSAITCSSNNVMNVTGTAGPQGTGYGIGVSVLAGGNISGGGAAGASVTVIGTGGGASGDWNYGVEIGGAGSTITGSGSVNVTGFAGPGASWGLYMDTSGAITIPAAKKGSIGISSDSISLDNTATITATNASSQVQINAIAATQINLGGADAAGTLGLSAAELAQITTPGLSISGVANGGMTISAPITFTSNTNLSLYPGSGSLNATASGTDLNLGGGTLYLNGGLNMPITGATADTGFPQLNVTGGVNLGAVDPVPFSLAGTTFAGTLGQTFTMIKNGGTSAIGGTFQNLPEGALLTWPGSPLFYAQISYVGGSGHDAVLTLVNASANVATTADTGLYSLRAAVAYAGASAGAQTVTFAPSMNGQTITLASQISISDTAGVTIDASNLTNGLTISGGGTNRVFFVSSGSIMTLKSLTVANGNDTSGNGGGAMFNNGGTVTVNNCTFTGNTTSTIGGAIRNYSGTLTVNQSTFSGNTSTGNGGAIGSGITTVNQCTISQNTSTAGVNGGGGITIGANTLTLRNSIVAGNTAPAGKPADIYNGSGLTRQGANIVQSFGGNAGTGPAVINASPLLAPLGNYGGPTMTMALEPGSPARNASSGSTINGDQRGFPIVGTPDIGAYEAGTTTNIDAWIWETLPGTDSTAQHALGYVFSGGVSILQSYAFLGPGQNPATVQNSQLPRLQVNAGSLTYSFVQPAGVAGVVYGAQFTTSLAPTNWQTVTDTGSGGTHTFTVQTAGATQLFLRLLVTGQ